MGVRERPKKERLLGILSHNRCHGGLMRMSRQGEMYVVS